MQSNSRCVLRTKTVLLGVEKDAKQTYLTKNVRLHLYVLNLGTVKQPSVFYSFNSNVNRLLFLVWKVIYSKVNSSLLLFTCWCTSDCDRFEMSLMHFITSPPPYKL